MWSTSMDAADETSLYGTSPTTVPRKRHQLATCPRRQAVVGGCTIAATGGVSHGVGCRVTCDPWCTAGLPWCVLCTRVWGVCSCARVRAILWLRRIAPQAKKCRYTAETPHLLLEISTLSPICTCYDISWWFDIYQNISIMFMWYLIYIISNIYHISRVIFVLMNNPTHKAKKKCKKKSYTLGWGP